MVLKIVARIKLASICTYIAALIGAVEADPEYQLIVDSNNLIVEIDNEISKYHLGSDSP